MQDVLEVAEGIQYQSSDEKQAYKITTTNWVSSPTSPVVAVFIGTTNEDVTSLVFPVNSPSANLDVITLSLLQNLRKGVIYRIEVRFSVGSSVYECYLRVKFTL